jgi:hypothetical protein
VVTILRNDLHLGRIELADTIDPTIERLAAIHPGTILRDEWPEPPTCWNIWPPLSAASRGG